MCCLSMDESACTARDAYLQALLTGERRKASAVVQRAIADGYSISRVYQHVFQPALYRIGELWETNRISVAAEHLATAITEGVMNELFPRLIAPRHVGRSIVVASVEKELHQVGGKMVCDLFEMRGWDTYFLGADTPGSELLRTLEELKPDLLGLSLSVYFHLPTLERMLQDIRTTFDELPVLIGGQGLRCNGGEVAGVHPGAHYIPDLDRLDAFIDRFPSITP